MTLLTMTDCSVADNRVQARHEMDLAERGELVGPEIYDRSMREWAQKWGRALIEAADGAVTEEDHAEDLRRAELEATDAENARDNLQAAINQAVSKLDAIECEPDVRALIDEAAAILENA